MMFEWIKSFLRVEAQRHEPEYEYSTSWGNDRRAEGPIKLRKDQGSGLVEWRYLESGWSAGPIPPEIAFMFE